MNSLELFDEMTRVTQKVQKIIKAICGDAFFEVFR